MFASLQLTYIKQTYIIVVVLLDCVLVAQSSFAVDLAGEEGLGMESEPKARSGTEKPIEKAQVGPVCASGDLDLRRGMNWRRFDPNVQITEGMTWHRLQRQTGLKARGRNPQGAPTWGFLFRQILIGLIEVLIPLAFILGMIYWRAPWLFWAMIHFLRGEPVFNF